MTHPFFETVWRYLKSRSLVQWVAAIVGAQLVLFVGFIVVGEWRYRSAELITIPVALVDRFAPIRGDALEFIPVPFRHAFKSDLPISPGDIVVVAPTDKSLSQWTILPDTPKNDRPYFRVKVISENDRYFFLEPPFQRVRLRESDQVMLMTYLNRPVSSQRLAIRVRHFGDMAIVSDLQVDGRLIPVR